MNEPLIFSFPSPLESKGDKDLSSSHSKAAVHRQQVVLSASRYRQSHRATTAPAKKSLPSERTCSCFCPNVQQVTVTAESQLVVRSYPAVQGTVRAIEPRLPPPRVTSKRTNLYPTLYFFCFPARTPQRVRRAPPKGAAVRVRGAFQSQYEPVASFYSRTGIYRAAVFRSGDQYYPRARSPVFI